MVETGAEADPTGELRQVSLSSNADQFAKGEMDEVLLGPCPGQGKGFPNEPFVENDVGTHGNPLCVWRGVFYTLAARPKLVL